MGISVTTGIASGIDYEEIIDATLAVEETKIEKYETKLEDYETEISALGEVKSALSTFQDALDELADSWDFFEYSATSSSEDVLTAAATDDATTGTYQIEVLQLAQQEILISSDGLFDSADDVVGSGTLTIQVGSEDAVDIEIDSDSTLADIKTAINQSDAGVTASIVTMSDGTYSLMLTGEETGQDISLSVTGDSDGNDTDNAGLSAFITDNMTVAQEGQTAQYSLGTVTFENDSNEIDGLIEGVTLTLSSVGTTTVNVSKDTEAMTEKVQALVDAYNSLNDVLDEYQDEGDEDSYGILFGDTTINNLRSRLRQLLFTEVENGDSNITYLSRLGVEVEDDGTISLDTDTFEEALADDAEGMMSFFTTQDTGFADVMNATLDGYLDWDGILASKIDGLELSVDTTEKKIETLEDKLDDYEEYLTVKYAALESLLSELTSTQESLTSLLDSLDTSS